MNKAELVAAMSAKTGESKKVTEETLNAFVEVVSDALKGGDKIQLDLDHSKLEKELQEKVEILKLKKR
mgnify:CR=1 FL=1